MFSQCSDSVQNMQHINWSVQNTTTILLTIIISCWTRTQFHRRSRSQFDRQSQQPTKHYRDSNGNHIKLLNTHTIPKTINKILNTQIIPQTSTISYSTRTQFHRQSKQTKVHCHNSIENHFELIHTHIIPPKININFYACA